MLKKQLAIIPEQPDWELPDLKATALPSEPVSFERAIMLFDELSGIKQIPFGYLADGCHARAAVMSDLLVRAGYAPMKAWIFNVEANMSMIPPKGEPASWWFHVAPALKVKLSKEKDEPLIFDPAMYDGPVTIQEWCRPIITECPEAVEIYMTAYNKCINEKYSTALKNVKKKEWPEELKIARDTLQDYHSKQSSRAVFQSSLRRVFNDQARKRILAEKLVINSPTGQIPKTLKRKI
ncbi:MAG: protein-glutamine glutaminase family protein [Pseudomonadota bacterium]